MPQPDWQRTDFHKARQTRCVPIRMSHPESEAQSADFSTTHWSQVFLAGQSAGPHAEVALEKLCCTYWHPLYAYVRRQGHSPHDAQDLTQEFFARLLGKEYLKLASQERGRFR